MARSNEEYNKWRREHRLKRRKENPEYVNDIKKYSRDYYAKNIKKWRPYSKITKWKKLGLDIDTCLFLTDTIHFCMLCGREDRRLVIDHNHQTGKIRGVLCDRCNVAIGSLGDNVAGLNRAIEYLRNAE